jgi:hypothetical protein
MALQEQLGLKLEPMELATKVLVIDFFWTNDSQPAKGIRFDQWTSIDKRYSDRPKTATSPHLTLNPAMMCGAS